MTLYFDLDTGVFCSGPGTRDTVSSLSFKRGDTVQIALRFVSGIVVQELAAGATGQIGLKAVGDYDGSFVASASSWTKVGTGTATVYNFTLDLNTVPLDTLLGVGAPADVASVPLNFELEFVASGVRTSSNTVTATIHNDVIRGDESTPTPLPDIIGSTAPRVDATVVISGTLTDGTNPVVFPVLRYAGQFNGSPSYTSDGLAADAVRTSPYYLCIMSGAPEWVIAYNNADDTEIAYWPSGDSASATPDLVSTWTPNSPATGTPTVEIEPTATPPFIRTAGGYLYIQEAGVWKKTALSAL